MFVFSGLILYTIMFIAGLYFLNRIYTDSCRVEVFFLVGLTVLSFILIIVGQSSKLIVLVEQSVCSVSKLDAVLPISVYN